MEIGAVVGAAPLENVIREVPEPGDIVILLGGKTGRDGCGEMCIRDSRCILSHPAVSIFNELYPYREGCTTPSITVC